MKINLKCIALLFMYLYNIPLVAPDDFLGHGLLGHAVGELRERHAQRAQVAPEVRLGVRHLARLGEELHHVRLGALVVGGGGLVDHQLRDNHPVEQLRLGSLAFVLGDALAARREATNLCTSVCICG